MPIYELFKQHAPPHQEEPPPNQSHSPQNEATNTQPHRSPSFQIPLQRDGTPRRENSLFSKIAARLFFLTLLLITLCWMIYIVAVLPLALLGWAITCGQLSLLHRLTSYLYLSLKRSSLATLALLLSLFSPALGMILACSYFMMYDRQGVEEVVPTVLRDHFQEFFDQT